MRRRITFGAGIGMLAVMLLGPSAASATTPFAVDMFTNSCVNGYMTSIVRAQAGGHSGADSMSVVVSLERRHNGHWRGIPSAYFSSVSWVPNDRPHGLSAHEEFQVPAGKTERAVFNFEAFSGSTELWEQTVHGIICHAPAV
jgi:hypothetical protein